MGVLWERPLPFLPQRGLSVLTPHTCHAQLSLLPSPVCLLRHQFLHLLGKVYSIRLILLILLILR